MFRIFMFRIFTFILFFSLVACSSSSDDIAAQKESASAEELYKTGHNYLLNKKYKNAIEYFDEVENQHPYSDWSPLSQIMSGYSYYQMQEYDDAEGVFHRFLKMHPAHKSTAYVYYMLALISYEQISDVGRDQGMTELAMQALRDLISRYPNSEYARDARLKLDLTNDHLAGKEMMVGRYYFQKDEFLSAINRFNYVVKNYQTTSHTPEALYRLVEIYLKIGIPSQAKKYAAVLGHNFSDSIWYRDAYKLMK